ncbi:hypothetical protein fugu_019203 [Takifugu bimaculatus]|uniref:Fibronectin type-III domain-containing protein n=1 Tax=Takifugu bimaculatus TaxID=433685 RepID=A0A4Z2BIM5_9TELE|nr:hypothetical protein fugu_019203 [Takifugu bimaculatus]
MTSCRHQISHERSGPDTTRTRGLLLALVAAFHHAEAVFPAAESCRDVLQHCRNEPDGVHDLDCFWERAHRGRHFCTWKPGRDPSEKYYMLLIHQTNKCTLYTNRTSTRVKISVLTDKVLKADVFEIGVSGVCTKDSFQGSMRNLSRCGPPDNVSFRRSGGRINVSLTWHPKEMKLINHFNVTYWAQGSPGWSKASQQSENATAGTVGSVDSSLAYSLEIRCVNNSECNQCMLSPVYSVPPELTTAPDLVDLKEADDAAMGGRRTVSVAWKLDPGKNAHDGYNVTIGKASGEAPRESFITTERQVTFILSYSSYHLEISAFNNVSTSPPLRHTIRRREEQLGVGAGKPNVTVHSNRSINISWRDDLMEKYVCYSAGVDGAWAESGVHVLSQQGQLQDAEFPRRYTLTLHVRPNKDTCNLKLVNNSESTYGTTQFYFLEGSPVGAPNVSSYNTTPDSAVLAVVLHPRRRGPGLPTGLRNLLYHVPVGGKDGEKAKRTLWPSIPNPEKSNTLQKIEMTNELELLQSISTLRVEDWETDSLQIIKREQITTAFISAGIPSLPEDSEDELGDVQETQAALPALVGGYTTMEMFRQAVPASTPAKREGEPDVTTMRSQLDYVRQFSTDSTCDDRALQ